MFGSWNMVRDGRMDGKGDLQSWVPHLEICILWDLGNMKVTFLSSFAENRKKYWNKMIHKTYAHNIEYLKFTFNTLIYLEYLNNFEIRL